MTVSRRRLPAALMLLAVTANAQPGGPPHAPPLPLRNLLIEVRQDDDENRSLERTGVDVSTRLQPGHTEAGVRVEAQGRQLERRGLAQQQVLVLNGRPAAFMLGHSVPLRLHQLVSQGGVRRIVPGTVWLQAGTGFTATPLWDGGELAYLELQVTQGRQVAAPASTTTTLLLPLGEWVTVAQSEDALDEQQRGLSISGGARETRSGSTRLRVQIRLSVR